MKQRDTRTLRELAQEALDIQNASNLSGLVLSWARAMERLNELLPGIGTHARNKHPINVLWADKLADLTGAAFGSYCSECYSSVGDIARGVIPQEVADTSPF